MLGPDAGAEVWLDADGVVRRLNMDVDTIAAGQSMQMTMSMGFSDFGIAVDVVAPPASETMDFEDVLGTGIGLGGLAD